MVNRTERIRELNDELRQHLLGGLAVMTPGIAALGQQAVERIVQTISVFDDFCHANDPHEEHDFGAFKAEGRTVFFKIDYYDKNLSNHSPDPSNPAVTERVITIIVFPIQSVHGHDDVVRRNQVFATWFVEIRRCDVQVAVRTAP